MGEQRTRVLVVDDELFFREAIRDVLSDEPVEVIDAADGESALELARDTAIGVAVLDIRLPGIDGLEVLRRLREARPELRVIMLSAHTDQERVLEALRLGACDYLAKPLHDEELRLAVRRAAEGFSVAEDWGRLRGRVERLACGLEDLATRAAEAAADERREVVGRAAARVASEVLEAARTSLMLLDESEGELRVASAVGRSVSSDEMAPVALGDGVAGLACARGEPLLVRDLSEDERFAERTAAEAEGRYESDSFAVAPVGRGDARLGVLCVTDRAGGGPFSQEDLGLLRVLAQQVGVLLRHEPRGQPVEASAATGPAKAPDADVHEIEVDGPGRGADVAELVAAVCAAIVDEVDPQRVFDAALRELARGLGAAPASIFLIDAALGELRCEASCDGGARLEREALPSDRGLAGSVVRTGRMVASATPEADARFDAEVDTPADGRAGPLLVVPLVLRGKVVGLFRAFPEDPADAAPAVGEAVGPALSAAVRNALLYRSLLDSIEELAEVRRSARA